MKSGSRGKGARRAPPSASRGRRRVAAWGKSLRHAVAAPEDLGPDTVSFEATSLVRAEKFIYKFDQRAAAGRWTYAAELVRSSHAWSHFRIHVHLVRLSEAQSAVLGCGGSVWTC